MELNLLNIRFIFYCGAQGLLASLLFVQGEIYTVYFDDNNDENLPNILNYWPIDGQIDVGPPTLLNTFTKLGHVFQCFSVHGSSVILVLLRTTPRLITWWYKLTSKYLIVYDRLTFETAIPNMKFLSGEAVNYEYVGSSFLLTDTLVLNELRLSVSIIILANPMKVVIMIARDRIPPVKVLYCY